MHELGLIESIFAFKTKYFPKKSQTERKNHLKEIVIYELMQFRQQYNFLIIRNKKKTNFQCFESKKIGVPLK